MYFKLHVDSPYLTNDRERQSALAEYTGQDTKQVGGGFADFATNLTFPFKLPRTKVTTHWLRASRLTHKAVLSVCSIVLSASTKPQREHGRGLQGMSLCL